jgi:hypothetical protein
MNLSAHYPAHVISFADLYILNCHEKGAQEVMLSTHVQLCELSLLTGKFCELGSDVTERSAPAALSLIRFNLEAELFQSLVAHSLHIIQSRNTCGVYILSLGLAPHLRWSTILAPFTSS